MFADIVKDFPCDLFGSMGRNLKFNVVDEGELTLELSDNCCQRVEGCRRGMLRVQNGSLLPVCDDVFLGRSIPSSVDLLVLLDFTHDIVVFRAGLHEIYDSPHDLICILHA